MKSHCVSVCLTLISNFRCTLYVPVQLLEVYTLLDTIKEIPGDIRYFLCDIGAGVGDGDWTEHETAKSRCDITTEESCKALTARFMKTFQEDQHFVASLGGRRMSYSMGISSQSRAESLEELHPRTPSMISVSTLTQSGVHGQCPPPPPSPYNLMKSLSDGNVIRERSDTDPLRRGSYSHSHSTNLVRPKKMIPLCLKQAVSVPSPIHVHRSRVQKKEELRKLWKLGNLRRASVSESGTATVTMSGLVPPGAIGGKRRSVSRSVTDSWTYSTMAAKVTDDTYSTMRMSPFTPSSVVDIDTAYFEDSLVADNEEESVESIENLEFEDDTGFEIQLTPFQHVRNVTDLSEIQESPEDERQRALDRDAYDHDFKSFKNAATEMAEEMSYSMENEDISDLEMEEEEHFMARHKRVNMGTALNMVNAAKGGGNKRRSAKMKKEVRFKNMKSAEYTELAQLDCNADSELATVRIQIADAAASSVSITKGPQSVNVQVTMSRIDVDDQPGHDIQDSAEQDMWILDDEEDEKVSPLPISAAITCGLYGVTPITPQSSTGSHYRPDSKGSMGSMGRMPFIAQSVTQEDDLEKFMVDIEDEDIDAAILSAHTPTVSFIGPSGHHTPSASMSESVTAEDVRLQFGRKQRIRASNMMSGDVRTQNQGAWTFGFFCT